VPTEKTNHGLAVHLAPWVALPLTEWWISRDLHPPHAWWQYALELTVFTALGAAQWRFARRPWLASLLWPAIIVLLAELAVAGPPPTRLARLALYVAGVVLLTTSLLRDLGDKVRVRPIVGVVAVVLGVVGARLLSLHNASGRLSKRYGGTGAAAVTRLWQELRGRSRPLAAARDEPPVVIITVDTLRADAARGMASHVRLRSRGAWWPLAMATSSWTMPSVGSIQTGLMPAEHGAVCLPGGHCQGLAESARTLAEDLRDAGYLTAAVTANPWISTSTGFDRGFDTFVDLAGVPPYRLLAAGPQWVEHPQDPAVTVDEALRWLEEAPDSGFYLWVHTLGPHMPYLHADDPELQGLDAAKLRNGTPVTSEQAERIRAAYLDEVAYTDAQILRLLDALERRGVLDRGLVVLTSDHGEEFWEHGRVEHGHSHHGEVISVPLVVAGAGVERGVRTDNASIVDVAATVRAVAGLQPEGFDLRHPLPDGRITTAWGNLVQTDQSSASDGATRAIVTESTVGSVLSIERFDLRTDPAERHPLLGDGGGDPVSRAALRTSGPDRTEAANLDTEALRALGYVQ
jgi:arylsulfatase A-like enzyme